MPVYSLFGAAFRSDFPFPELSPADDATEARWTFCRADGVLAGRPQSLVGEEEVNTGVRVRLYDDGARLVVEFDDTGTFEITARGTELRWYAPEAPRLEDVRQDLLGRVLALALHQAGVTTLHGSAVEIGGEAVAFLAPKLHGKSTTAAALVNSGARLVADDLVAVTSDTQPRLLPSVIGVNLWRDSAAHLGADSSMETVGGKLRVRWDDSARRVTEPSPLAAIYLLVPVSDLSAQVRRSRVPSVEATVALLGQTKVGGLLGAAHRADLLVALAKLVERVPVFRLEIPRSFAQLDSLTSSMFEWHGGVATIPHARTDVRPQH